MLALKRSRYRALDHIFTKFMRECLSELANVIKKDFALNRKWNIYVGMDMYMPTLLVWMLLRERSRPDIKRRLTQKKDFATLPIG